MHYDGNELDLTQDVSAIATGIQSTGVDISLLNEDTVSAFDWTLTEPSNVINASGALPWSEFDADTDFMALFSQSAGLDYESWLQDFNDIIAQTLPSGNVTEAMARAVDMMKEHFQRKSASSSSSFVNHSWFSAAPDMSVYHPQMLKALINLARSKMSSTFRIFEDFDISQGAAGHLFIAMAAVGALYCDVNGSARVAKMCYNDARRTVLAATLTGTTPDFDELLSRTKTFILMEIYGLCSGDARSFESVEVFHGFTLQAVRSCMLHSQEHQTAVSASPLEAFQILESYRVNLLQRPPTLANLADTSLSARNQANQNEDVVACFDHLESITQKGNNFSDLAVIASLVWFPTSHGVRCSSDSVLWKADFVELALHRWQRGHEKGDPWALLMYHLALITLHANMMLLQRHAVNIARNGAASANSHIPTSIRGWIASRHYRIARWNAERILSISSTALGVQHWTLSAITDGERLRRNDEPPHLPFAIFFSSLVLWYGGLSKAGNRSLHHNHLEAGARLLSHLNVHVAKNLSDVLYELLV